MIFVFDITFSGNNISEDSIETLILKYIFVKNKKYLLYEKILADNTIDTSVPNFRESPVEGKLYQVKDSLGSGYYFRGPADNNYVLFAGFYWRIVRINDNNSVRLIY